MKKVRVTMYKAGNPVVLGDVWYDDEKDDIQFSDERLAPVVGHYLNEQHDVESLKKFVYDLPKILNNGYMEAKLV